MPIVANNLEDSCPICGAPIIPMQGAPSIRTCRCTSTAQSTQGFEPALAAQSNELSKALEDMVQEHCQQGAGDETYIDSQTKIANNNAILLLARLGKLTITGKAGKRILAKWV
jgi:hypothetical protein